MVAIALLAALFTAVQMGWRWKRARDLAALHRDLSDFYAFVPGESSPSTLLGVSKLAVEEVGHQMEKARKKWSNLLAEAPDDRTAGDSTAAEQAKRHLQEYERAEAERVTVRSLFRRRAVYHSMLIRKYLDASCHPWLPIEPEPPPPKP